MKLIRYILLIVVFFVISFAAAPGVFATTFDLIAPIGQLTRGQDVAFTINIDTEGQSLTSTEIGMTYQADLLQYISTTPGQLFTNVNVTPQDGGKLIFSATNPTAFSGTGTFATVNFKLIATAPGSTQLCVLFAPSASPPPTAPTSPPPPPPQTGYDSYGNTIIVGSLVLLTSAFLFLTFNRKNKYK